MALRYLGLTVSLMFQKSNEKYRRLGKISIFLQGRLKWSWSGVTIFCKLDEDAACRSQISYSGLFSYPYFSWRGVSLWLIFLCIVGLNLNDAPHYLKRIKNPGLCLRLDHENIFLFSFDGKPANRRFCRGPTRNKRSGVERQNGWWPPS